MRRHIRLYRYDYSQAGAYFVTVVTQGRHCLFGDIVDGEMHPDAAGRMVARWWEAITSRFPGASTDAFAVMPNHLHGVATLVGADQCVRPPSLFEIVRWSKTMTTNEYINHVRGDGWPPFARRLWQRNYYEHVVRDEADLERVRQYIDGNPGRWAEDGEYLHARGSPPVPWTL